MLINTPETQKSMRHAKEVVKRKALSYGALGYPG